MGVLAEYVKSEADHLRGESGRKEAARNDWLAALARLMERLRQWVAEADGGHGLLEATLGQQLTRHETLLGVYTVAVLSITLGGRLTGRTATVVPRARYVAALIEPSGGKARRADGFVEIKSDNTAEYYLFRVAGENPEQDEWYIQSAAKWDFDPKSSSVDELDRDRFEAAILRVLR